MDAPDYTLRSPAPIVLIVEINNSDRRPESAYRKNGARAVALFYFSKEVPRIASGKPLAVR
jgi:hypothetical protein